MSGIQRGYGYQYETVAASQTAQVLGGSGAAGGPASVATGVGVLDIELNMASLTSGWKVTTGAGVTVVAVGQFS